MPDSAGKPDLPGGTMLAGPGAGHPGTLGLILGHAISQKRWKTILAPYEGPDNLRSLLQVAVTLLLYATAWAVLLRSVEVSYWLTAVVAAPAAGLMMRLFVIQHDCSHGSYFTSQRAANAVGRVVAALVLTPYEHMRSVHAAHHAHSGNLDKSTVADIETLTVAEYRALGRRGRLQYRLVRNPFLLIGVLTTLQFLVVHRLPRGAARFGTREWRSVWGTNAAIAVVLVGVWLVFGLHRLEQVLVIQGMLLLYGGPLGGWITHTQHQFEDAYWRRTGEWNYFEAGLRGASWLALPKPLQWLTANIGLHHVHHLSTRIPNYRLQRCHDENPELWSAHRITLRDAFKGLHLALWDERRSRLISFGEYRRLAHP